MSAYKRISPTYKAMLKAIDGFRGEWISENGLVGAVADIGLSRPKIREMLAALVAKRVLTKNKTTKAHKVTALGVSTILALDELPVLNITENLDVKQGKKKNLPGGNTRPPLPSESKAADNPILPASMSSFAESAAKMMGEFSALREANERYLTEVAEILGYTITKKEG